MIKYGLAAVVVSIIWFLVRIGLGIPDNTPLFHEGIFLFADRLAVIVGIAGAILLAIGAISRFSEP